MISRLVPFSRKNLPRPATLSPESLIIHPLGKAAVTRLTNGRFHLQWQQPPETIRIYANHEPALNDTARLWAVVTGAHAVLVPPMPDIRRPYFILEFAPNDHFLVAERFLPVPHSLNFRDCGGYETENGRFVRWGQVYRSGTLAHLQTEDFAFIQELGVRLVCDLRSSHETENAPDRLPPNADMQHLLRPLSSAGSFWQRVQALHHYRHDINTLLIRLYQETFIDENAPHIGDILTRLADPTNRPALLHCSAGKDRTGVTIALLLAVLGVPDETIIADYSLSNLAYARIQEVMGPELKQSRWIGVRAAQMQPLLLASPDNLRQTFTYIRAKYGSITAYLTDKAGVSLETLTALQTELVQR